ncbi:putative RNA polymerase II subunit B1 CTD phosphatase rpap2 [Daphnia carinata]|uniref:putative RNA polymerase II subunit B1 CTD phosphatase rpap2 n=1 Tax=Daphnia carinata TaxID=120202 RepID=UPI00257D6D6A|nr:putative RNA polymerase II subunit B1 CTD phosphatase rpap2 [Daphnia carinata]
MNQNANSKEVLREKRAAVEAAFRKKKISEQRALGTVEYMVESLSVDPHWLTSNGRFLNPSYYQDAVEERAIIKQCGFPICPNIIEKVWKQKYCIDLKSKKVYDVTQRKNFCSDICFSASNHFKNQLLTSPLWMRDKEKIPTFEINLALKKGLPGDYIPLITAVVADEDGSSEDIPEVVVEKTVAKPKMVQRTVLRPTVNPYEFVLKIVQQWLTVKSFKWLERIDEVSLGEDVECIQKQLHQMEINKHADTRIINHLPEPLELAAKHSDPKREAQPSLSQVRAFLAGHLEYAVENANGDGKAIKDNITHVIEKTENEVPIVIPLANASSQKILRRKIVMDYVEKWFPKLATITGLEFRRYQRDLTQLVSTFNLAADTITLRPHEVSLMCFILLFLLSVRDPAIKERLTSERIQLKVAKFLAAYERTMEEFEKDIDVLREAFDFRMNCT